MIAKDYNNIKWEDYFYLDETSPSGLRWKFDRVRKRNKVTANAGDSVGTLKKRAGTSQGWYIMLDSVVYLVHRIIYVLINGSIAPDLVIDHLNGDAADNTHSNLALKSRRANQQNLKMSSKNTSGVVGVHLTTKLDGLATYQSWMATWYNTDHKRLSRSFSTNLHGYDEAFLLAVAYRTDQIKLLNATGQCYTDRHVYNKPKEINSESS